MRVSTGVEPVALRRMAAAKKDTAVLAVVVARVTTTKRQGLPIGEGMRSANARRRKLRRLPELNGSNRKTKDGNLWTRQTCVTSRKSSRGAIKEPRRQPKLLRKLQMMTIEQIEPAC